MICLNPALWGFMSRRQMPGDEGALTVQEGGCSQPVEAPRPAGEARAPGARVGSGSSPAGLARMDPRSYLDDG